MYEHAEQNKSELYGSFLPMLNSRTVALLQQRSPASGQLLALERRTGRGRDVIDHRAISMTTLPTPWPVRWSWLSRRQQFRCRASTAS
jgi:hypothetical protein